MDVCVPVVVDMRSLLCTLTEGLVQHSPQGDVGEGCTIINRGPFKIYGRNKKAFLLVREEVETLYEIYAVSIGSSPQCSPRVTGLERMRSTKERR